MERITLDFSLANFITIGLIAAAWYIVFVGGFSVVVGNSSVKASGS